MSELVFLLPYEPSFVHRYVAAVQGRLSTSALVPGDRDWIEREITRAQRGHTGAMRGQETGANAISYGLARLLASVAPTFFVPGLGFTQLEARYDRGLGMLLRPPSRLFGEAGLETAAARSMPIRLDTSGTMGGAFMPPSLTPRFQDLLEERLERLAPRLTEAELDAPALLGTLLQAAGYAADHELGLYEAADVFVPGVRESAPPGMQLIAPDRKHLDRDLRRRLEAASRPPREPGLLARVFGRGRASVRPGFPEETRQWRGMNDVTPPPPPPLDRNENAHGGWPE